MLRQSSTLRLQRAVSAPAPRASHHVVCTPPFEYTSGARVAAEAVTRLEHQALLAAKASSTYVSLFAGRIGDEGHDPAPVIRATRTWLDEWGYPSQIIVGSIRAVFDIQVAAQAGAHIITVPPEFLPKLVDHKYSRETEFVADAQQAMSVIAAVTR